MLPKGITVRKVRASQGRIADNVSRRRLPGKCNRNKPPARVRMERRGKSSPTSMVTWICCKPYPKQHRMRIVCPTHILRWHKPRLEAVWQHTAKIDNRPRQNPAYRQDHPDRLWAVFFIGATGRERSEPSPKEENLQASSPPPETRVERLLTVR